MIFVGPLYDPAIEKEILKYSCHGISNASNQYQIDLLKGILDNKAELKVINALPVGAWPKHYKKFALADRNWEFEGAACCEVGCFNLPVIKQLQREIRVRKLLKRMVCDDREIVVYSAFLPFLRAVKSLSKEIKVTLVVTDLPEYYDLGKTSKLRRILRKMNNRMIGRCLDRVDRYVLLTEQMKDRLPVRDKPYTVVEGIWSGNADPIDEMHGTKKAIFYAGTLHRQFGILTLLDAFAKLPDEDAELWLCGAGDCSEEIEKRAAQDARIKFFGYVSSDKVAEMRKEAMLLVNPRTNEGEYTKYSFPSKTMGYMASGKPVVMYRLDGTPREYDEYLIYPEGLGADALKDAIQKVFSMTEEERNLFGARAQRFIVDQKNAKLQVKKIVDMFVK